jgi:hypothetical protein
MWGDARKSYGVPSRRKKTWPKNIVLDDIKNPGESIKIAYADYPAAMMFYLMKSAGALIGLSEDVDQSATWQFRAIVDDVRIKAFEEKYPGKLTSKFKHVPESFARLIAKIGYGQILCSLDVDDFDPVCLPYIMGKKANPSYIVGGRWSIPEPNPGIGYELSSHCIGTTENLLLVAEIRLFANCHTPVYHVIIGTVTGRERVTRVTRKIEATYSVTIENPITYKPIQDDKFHWMPRLWPLPIFRK